MQNTKARYMQGVLATSEIRNVLSSNAYDTLRQMLGHRGYALPNVQPMSSCSGRRCTLIRAPRAAAHAAHPALHVVLCLDSAFRAKETLAIRQASSDSDPITQLVIVTRAKPVQSVTLRKLQTLLPSCSVLNVTATQLSCAIYEACYQPRKCRVLRANDAADAHERADYMHAMGCDKSSAARVLPLILESDPLSVYYGAGPGDLFMATDYEGAAQNRYVVATVGAGRA